MGKFEEFQNNVICWSKARKIIPRSTPFAQANKTLEEAGEVLESAARLKLLEQILQDHPTLEPWLSPYLETAMRELQDGIGDVLVTVVNVAALAGLDINDCCDAAWKEIKDRTGELGEDGIFRKDR